MKKVKFIDLFAGVGGFHQALSDFGGECVFSSEIDFNARKTYEANYRLNHPQLFDSGNFNEDITLQDENLIPNHDILCAGFPCQAFSIAGYQKGFEDNRGTLFFDIVKILKAKKTSIIFLENVKNLASHAEGQTLKLMLKMLKKEGYFVKYKIMNSMEYGNIPQNRERIYIVGFRNKKHFERFKFPEKIDLKTTLRDVLEDDVDEKYYYNGKSLYSKLKKEVKRYDRVYQWRRQYVRENKSGVFPTLTANMGTGGHNVPIILDKKGIRKITPREAFLIQGYRKDFVLPNLADSHLYKQAGNSVSVPVVKRVAKNILQII